MKKQCTYLTKHLSDLRAEHKVTYRGHVYWLQRDWGSDGKDLYLTDECIYRHSIDEEILGGILGYKYGEVRDHKVYRTED